MPMQDGRNTLKRIEFEVGDRLFKFAINPENYVDSRPHRTAVSKTKSQIIVEDFQSDVPTINISGTTGFNPTGKVSDRGINRIKEMKTYIEEYAEMGGNGDMPHEEFYFHNHTNDESFVVHLSPEGITYSQSVDSPLTYRYDITLIVLRKAEEPASEDVTDPEIGNRQPSIDNKDEMPYGGSRPPDRPPRGFDYEGSDTYSGGRIDPYRPDVDNRPVNPQAPSPTSYSYGASGLSNSIGYAGGNA